MPLANASKVSQAAVRPTERRFIEVQSRVGDRIRLAVHGLYRNPGLRRRLERELPQIPGLRMARVNELTGRVLLIVQPAVSDHGEILDAVEQTLASGDIPPRGYFPAEPEQPLEDERAAAPVPVTSGGEPWHALSARQAAAVQGVSPRHGLSSDEAALRLAQFGPNSLPQPPRRSGWSILLSQYQNLPAVLLGASAALSVVTGGLADAMVIAGVLAINGWIGFRSESEAERTISSLADSSPRRAKVVRDGELRELGQDQLVPGDLVCLEAGTEVGADVRLLRSANLHVDESALTGESVPALKRAAVIEATAAALADRRNMAYMGTIVTAGSGMGVVTATGNDTAIGEINALIGASRAPATPMQRQLDHLSTRLALASGAVCLAVFGLGILRGYPRLAMLKAAISLGVAAIPEGLGTVATTTLAMGVRGMRRQRVAVRRLDAVETLGAVQAICLDKTGTLTENRMSVVAVQANGRRLDIVDDRYRIEQDAPSADPTLRRLWEVAALCNDAEVEKAAETANGSSTERALLRTAAAMGVDIATLQADYPRRATRARADARPYMATYHALGGGRTLVAVKGSPAHVLDLCNWYLHDGRRARLDDGLRARILDANQSMAGESLRVLGLAYTERTAGNGAPSDLTWLGLVGMTDPIRPGLDRLMAQFHRAGIRTIMITGDQRETAHAIGQQLNLGEGEPLEILDASRIGQIEQLEPVALAERVSRLHVFARVTPAHKLHIVQALQKAGMVVAMTGDGINDGPALRAADIGIAMGHGGTVVARTVADVVLEDDNLHTMLVAVEQGRTIYDNIRKAIRYLVATNCSEIALMTAGIGLGMGAPLTPMQLLWINLVTDIFPALALTLEPPAPDVLRRPPRDASRPIIRREDLGRLMVEAGVLSSAGLAAFAYGRFRYGGGPAAAGIAFQTLAGAQLLHAISARSESEGIFRSAGRPGNRALNLAIGGSLGLQLLAQVLPPLRRLLGLGPLRLLDLLVVGAGAVLPLLVNEARKTPMRGRDREWSGPVRRPSAG